MSAMKGMVGRLLLRLGILILLRDRRSVEATTLARGLWPPRAASSWRSRDHVRDVHGEGRARLGVGRAGGPKFRPPMLRRKPEAESWLLTQYVATNEDGPGADQKCRGPKDADPKGADDGLPIYGVAGEVEPGFELVREEVGV